MELLLLFDLGPIVFLAGPEVFACRQPQFEMNAALDGGALGAATQFVPAFNTRRRDFLLGRQPNPCNENQHRNDENITDLAKSIRDDTGCKLIK